MKTFDTNLRARFANDANKRTADRRFEFHKRGQLFVRTRNETLSVVAMRINNPDCSTVGIDG
jgi:hypothetical protein